MIRPPSAGAGSAGRGCGAVAQLGERRVRNAKVRGSTPLGSTTPPPGECLLVRNASCYRARRLCLFFALACEGRAHRLVADTHESHSLSDRLPSATANGKRLAAEHPRPRPRRQGWLHGQPKAPVGTVPEEQNPSARERGRTGAQALKAERPRPSRSDAQAEASRCPVGSGRYPGEGRPIQPFPEPGDFPAEPGRSLGHPAVREPDRRPWFVECNKRACKA